MKTVAYPSSRLDFRFFFYPKPPAAFAFGTNAGAATESFAAAAAKPFASGFLVAPEGTNGAAAFAAAGVNGALAAARGVEPATEAPGRVGVAPFFATPEPTPQLEDAPARGPADPTPTTVWDPMRPSVAEPPTATAIAVALWVL